jgi:hypothetical protein
MEAQSLVAPSERLLQLSAQGKDEAHNQVMADMVGECCWSSA